MVNNEQVLEAFVGLQWGDEGKGKIVDERVRYAQSLNDGKRVIVIRYQGGANAGHSVYFRNAEGKLLKFVTHAAPSGLTSGADIAIGPHVAFNPLLFHKELTEARKFLGYNGRAMISERTGVLFDYHQKIDALRENQGGGAAVGSTKQGIGPFYEDNSRRTTRITFFDYVSDRFPDKLRSVLALKKSELEAAGIWRDDYADEIIAAHETVRKELKPFSERLEYRLWDYFLNGNHMFSEGAQATGLDADMGTIPDQTPSHLLAPNAFPGLGLHRIDFKIYGIEKIYPTRVGLGVLPTLARNSFGEEVATNGGEVGATTGRKRRVGFPDWVFVKRSAIINDCDGIYLMRADVVQDQDILVCRNYEFSDGQLIAEVPLDLSQVKPVYDEERYRWHLWDGPKDLSKPEDVDAQLRELRQAYVRGGIDSLPERLRDYVRDHDSFVGVPSVGISIGPGRGETVRLAA